MSADSRRPLTRLLHFVTQCWEEKAEVGETGLRCVAGDGGRVGGAGVGPELGLGVPCFVSCAALRLLRNDDPARPGLLTKALQVPLERLCGGNGGIFGISQLQVRESGHTNNSRRFLLLCTGARRKGGRKRWQALQAASGRDGARGGKASNGCRPAQRVTP